MDHNPLLPPLPTSDAHPTQAIPPVHALTAPQGTTLMPSDAFFHCSIPNASIHRKDGKRIAFIHGFAHSNVKEDVDFLRAEIASGHPYLREVTGDEILTARAISDPIKALEEQIRAKVLQELAASGALNPGVKPPEQASIQKASADAAKIAGTDLAALARARVQAMQASGAIPAGGAGVRITPVSSADVANATSQSGR